MPASYGAMETLVSVQAAYAAAEAHITAALLLMVADPIRLKPV